MNRAITCWNEDGAELVFTELGFTPFILAKAEGIYDIVNTVNISDNVMIDGGQYGGTTMAPRNIILTVKDIDNYDTNRELIDQVFKKGSPGTLCVEEGTHKRICQYYVENVSSEVTPEFRNTVISLLCPDPYFYDTDSITVGISDLMSDFEFEHEFLQEGEEFGHFNEERIGELYNESADDHIGLNITIAAEGEVTNPRITKIETQEFIQVGTDDYPLRMTYGDELLIVTETGKKNVYLNGESVNYLLTEDSEFIQLSRGKNSIGYSALSGTSAISVNIVYRYRYMRA